MDIIRRKTSDKEHKLVREIERGEEKVPETRGDEMDKECVHAMDQNKIKRKEKKNRLWHLASENV